MLIGDVLGAAREATGLDDFGDDSFREGLAVMVRSLESEADLTPAGLDQVRGQLVRTLSNRLQVEDWYRRHPEIDEQEIIAPVVQLGLPRTGSTALGNLLAEDPAVRSLRTWEAGTPCPPPEKDHEHDDPRIAQAQAGMDAQLARVPELAAMVPRSAAGPTECLFLLALDFRSGSAVSAKKVPSFSAWLLDCDMEPGYRYHKKMLKLLQWRCGPTRWRLRSPIHMSGIYDLDKVYPDAQFVMTHRDVTKVIPSVSSLLATVSSLVGQDDPHYFGGFAAQLWETALRRTVAFRDDGREHRFHDLGFREVQDDPIGSVRKLYASLGEQLSPQAEDRMTKWWAGNSRVQGGHRYTAEEFGLDAAELRSRFAFYTDRFDIPEES
jgi:hypothetical protein